MKDRSRSRSDRDGHAVASEVRLVSAGICSLSVALLVTATGLATETEPGAPTYWPWVLTGLQVLALWAAGRRYRWGWLLGAAVQPPWIAYALVTGQLGFIPGCLISSAVQAASFLRDRREPSAACPTPELRPAEAHV